LIPNLLVREIVAAIRASQATKIYIQNIMTQPGETVGYTAADHVQAMSDHCDGTLFPNILVNNRPPSLAILKKYDAEHAGPVTIDIDRLRTLKLNVVEWDLLDEDGVVRHDPDRLAQAVFQMGNL
jgi:uncharacterized cofD-like protein